MNAMTIRTLIPAMLLTGASALARRMRVQLERRAAESSSGSDRALFEASADERELARARAASDGRGGPAAAGRVTSDQLLL